MQASAAPAASSWVPTDHKPLTFEQSKTSGGQIHITATTSYDGCATPAYEARALGCSAGAAVLPDAVLSPAPRMSKKCSAPIPSGICERSSMMYEPESFRGEARSSAFPSCKATAAKGWSFSASSGERLSKCSMV